MSIYSTRTISRSEAEEMYRAKKNVRLDNEDLGNELDRLYSNETLNNYIVVNDEDLRKTRAREEQPQNCCSRCEEHIDHCTCGEWK